MQWAAGGPVGGVSSSRANPDSQYYAMVCSHCQGRHWFSTVYTNPQVICPQCRKPTPFNQLVEEVTRSGPLGTGDKGRVAGQNYAATCNQAEAAAAEEAGGRAGPSNRADPGAGARYDEKKRKQELSQQMGDMTSPSKPPAPKKPKDGGGDGGGHGGSASQAIEFSQ